MALCIILTIWKSIFENFKKLEQKCRPSELNHIYHGNSQVPWNMQKLAPFYWWLLHDTEHYPINLKWVRVVVSFRLDGQMGGQIGCRTERLMSRYIKRWQYPSTERWGSWCYTYVLQWLNSLHMNLYLASQRLTLGLGNTTSSFSLFTLINLQLSYVKYSLCPFSWIQVKKTSDMSLGILEG